MSEISASSKKAKKGSRIARLKAARLYAVQAIYQMRSSKQDARDIISEYKLYRFNKPIDGQDMVAPDETLFSQIVSGVSERGQDFIGVIDASLEQHIEGKSSHSLKNLDPLLGSILLCASYEFMACHETESPIIISSYLDVTQAFYDSGETKLVNASLDKIKKSFRDA